ncbi:DUF6339 family protein [Streptomyces castrisilvae]|uniref:DUF6339 family protein n=1 Tax=Streptomyces castrisilvae TaxID=3033811 RepID=A0ABY9HHH2_9ACTN|nr:DUF6339 family protein [Streptomyces sp. Mut1]WLQ33975.1 DUF6339 family protein [Streptomyces sp. Mut1]
MNRTHTEIPARLALLPGARATGFLTHGVRAGQEALPHVALLRASRPIQDDSVRWNVDAVREIVEEAMRRFDAVRTDADAWLAPRLHATLRLTRAEAADAGLWNFLALAVAPDFVLWRHLPPGAAGDGSPKKTNSARFVGPHYSQAFARLWWSAEMFRDGPDYRPAEIACGNQDMINTALRLDAIDHKPTALALVSVLKGLADGGATRLGDRVNALCTAVNVAGSTLMYEVIAPDDPPRHDALTEWIADAESAAVPWERLPDGPDDGTVRRSSLEILSRMFEQFSAEAPLRDRAPSGAARD